MLQYTTSYSNSDKSPNQSRISNLKMKIHTPQMSCCQRKPEYPPNQDLSGINQLLSKHNPVPQCHFFHTQLQYSHALLSWGKIKIKFLKIQIFYYNFFNVAHLKVWRHSAITQSRICRTYGCLAAGDANFTSIYSCRKPKRTKGLTNGRRFRRKVNKHQSFRVPAQTWLWFRHLIRI